MAENHRVQVSVPKRSWDENWAIAGGLTRAFESEGMKISVGFSQNDIEAEKPYVTLIVPAQASEGDVIAAQTRAANFYAKHI